MKLTHRTFAAVLLLISAGIMTSESAIADQSAKPAPLMIQEQGSFAVGAAGVELTSDDLNDIDSAVSTVTVQGARYPEHLQKLVGR
jgi:hypothetical protein